MVRTFMIAVGLAAFSASTLSAQTVPAPAPAKAPPPACTSIERGQLDFWVGKWDVYPTGKDRLVAHSLIEKLYGDCAVRENWMPLGGPGGGSLSSYDPRTRKWHQNWVDSSGATVAFDGGWDGSKMVIEGLWPDVLGPGQGCNRSDDVLEASRRISPPSGGYDGRFGQDLAAELRFYVQARRGLNSYAALSIPSSPSLR